MLGSKKKKFFGMISVFVCILTILVSCNSASVSMQPVKAADINFKFDFGSGAVEKGYIGISATTAYSSSVGYGFESTSGLDSCDRQAPDALKGDFVFSDNTFTFKVDLANGSYNVRVVCGDQTSDQGAMSVTAEGVTQFTANADAGNFIDKTFTVAVGDGQMNITFSGGKPSRINLIEISTAALPAPRQMEKLDRGLVAVLTEKGVYVGWRMFGTEPDSISFNIYRDGKKINETPIISSTNYLDPSGTADSTYYVRAVLNGVEQKPSEKVRVWGKNSLTIPLQKPEGGTTPDKVNYTYEVGEAVVADLDGDSKYEIVVKWDPTNMKDNSQSGYTGNQIIDAYEMDGTRLWRIDLGINIRSGHHYTQLIVYDLDGDGKAELACKTADGSKDGKGVVIGNATADYRTKDPSSKAYGHVLAGPEYLTVFNGQTGAAVTTIDYEPERGTISSWGDSYGNRVDRFLAAVAYLDGVHPSLVMCRGYYTRSVLVAYDYKNGKLTKRWTFDTDKGYSSYAGQGNHNLAVGDVDNDGKDEIIYGACAIDDDGTGMYTTGLGHGDSIHLGDLNPSRAGLELFDVHENSSAAYGLELRDPLTGQILWGLKAGKDVGRALTGDIDPRYVGEECWANDKLYAADGTLLNSYKMPSTVFALWWDADPLREIQDNNTIYKWDYINNTERTIFTAIGNEGMTGTRRTPILQADIFGDWREELVLRSPDSTSISIFTTTDVTDRRIYTLMHDPVYRLAVQREIICYNMPPHTGFYLGEGMAEPPKPNIYLVPPEK